MEVSHFKIFNASAGSGKTYSLTKEYLLLLLKHPSPNKFRQILAITFTNKAVDEMKSRILQSLFEFGKDKDADQRGSMFKELSKELGISPSQLQLRSQDALKRILHNYSFFDISTIDKFNHRVIKTFARDLQLSQSFEVELDTDLLLNEAVGRLLERAGREADLTQALISFSLEKIDDDKSWDISHDLANIGKLLFQENHSDHLSKLQSKSIADFKSVQKNIASQINLLEQNVVNQASQVLDKIQSLGFAPEDFPRQTLPNHFKKIIAGDFNVKTLYANKLKESLEAGKLLKASDTRDTTDLAEYLLGKYLHIRTLLHQRHYLQNIYGNLVPLSLLNEIAKEIKNIELDRDVIPISALNSLLSKEVKNQPVPFIYERMGEKYRHYFIDEFQDTSKVQWENLIPLIGNALESANEKNEIGSLFLVGDVKQAIYRWRGGRAEQFLNLINRKSRPFTITPQVFSLDTNWRSHKEIVQFNNQFFGSISAFLKNADYRKLFEDGSRQQPNPKEGGYVRLSFLDQQTEDEDQAYCEEVLKIIGEAQSKQFGYADICILVREKKHGNLLANFLSNHQIPIVSSESLLLKANPVIDFLISLLYVIDDPCNQEATYAVLLHLAKNKSDPHQFIGTHLDQIETLMLDTNGLPLEELRTQSVLSILERAIQQFGLADHAPAYLVFLLDEVLILEKREGPGIHAFLSYWEQKKDKLSIAAPEHINAVKIMTIHKSKGLEFPVVIFPFANGLINDRRKSKKSWVPADVAQETLGLSEFLIDNKKEMLLYNDVAAKVFMEEEEKTELDAINVLYVALTRAEKALFVISEMDSMISTLDQCKSYADLFQYYLQQKGGFSPDQKNYIFGEFQENGSDGVQKMESISIPFAMGRHGAYKFGISTQSAYLWEDSRREAVELGNLIHHTLSIIKTREDVDPALKQLIASGQLNLDDSEYVAKKVLEVVGHPQLQSYFEKGYQILNEQEILLPNGKRLRPDRIAIKDSTVTILDYKTGKPSPSHKEQIMEYADALKSMDYIIGHIIIVYIDREITPLFL
nr:UvrD-helicase domain-containing protein [Allomuricauda sp.]